MFITAENLDVIASGFAHNKFNMTLSFSIYVCRSVYVIPVSALCSMWLGLHFQANAREGKEMMEIVHLMAAGRALLLSRAHTLTRLPSAAWLHYQKISLY